MFRNSKHECIENPNPAEIAGSNQSAVLDWGNKEDGIWEITNRFSHSTK